MRRYIPLFLILFLASSLYSKDIPAITDDGRKVLLHEDGRWTYVLTENNQDDGKFFYAKSDSADAYVVARIGTVRFWYDPNKWDMQRLTDGSAEYQFVSIDGSLYARIISEKMKVPNKLMREIIEANARKSVEFFEPIEENEVVINGIATNRLKVRIQMKGVELLFLYYYFSNDLGTMQLFSYSSSELFNQYENEINEFMSGIMKEVS